MPLLHEERDQDIETRHPRGGEREITLGTMTILAIFFALAILCAGFFGFGYSTGRKSVPGPQAASAASVLSNFSLGAPKPSAASPLGAAAPTPQPLGQGITGPVPQDLPPAARLKPGVAPAAVTRFDPDAEVVGAPSSRAASATPTVAVTPPPESASEASSPSPAGPFMVQVAAFSHQEDADMTVSALRRAHYIVSIRSEPQDKLLHVQIGPFTNRKEADAMRQRVVADGFHAIVK